MSAATLFAQPFWYARDDDGHPIQGATLAVFLAGTSTPVDVFHDANLTDEWDQPIETNSAGQSEGPIFVTPLQSLKLVATDANGVPLAGYPMDDWNPYVLE